MYNLIDSPLRYYLLTVQRRLEVQTGTRREPAAARRPLL